MNQNVQNQPANISFYSKLGQETVQDIVSKTTDMLHLIKAIQLPSGTPASNNLHEERKNRLKNDFLKVLSLSFKRLYKIYEKCLEQNLSIEDIEPEQLIPLEDGPDLNIKRTPNEAIKEYQKEYNEQLKILKSKNLRIKEIIDDLREIVWSLNTMLAMKQNK